MEELWSERSICVGNQSQSLLTTLHEANALLANYSCQQLFNDSSCSSHFILDCNQEPSNQIKSDITKLIFTCFFTLVICASTIGNGTVIWIVCYHKRMRTVTNYFLLNLAISDCLITLLNLTPSFTYNVFLKFYFGAEYCYMNNLFGVAPTCASSTTLMLMSWERYQVITCPLKSRQSRKCTLSMICGVWLLSIGIASPNAYYTLSPKLLIRDARSGTFDQSQLCYASTPQIYEWLLLVIEYVLPAIVLSYTFIFIARTLWFGQSIGEHEDLDRLKAKKRVVKMLFTVDMIFMCCWLPYHLYFLLFFHVLPHFYFLLVYLLAMSTSVWPPIIYYHMNQRFRLGFKYAFRWLPFVHFNHAAYRSCDLFEQRVLCTARMSNCIESNQPSCRQSSTFTRQSPSRASPPNAPPAATKNATFRMLNSNSNRAQSEKTHFRKTQSNVNMNTKGHETTLLRVNTHSARHSLTPTDTTAGTRL